MLVPIALRVAVTDVKFESKELSIMLNTADTLVKFESKELSNIASVAVTER